MASDSRFLNVLLAGRKGQGDRHNGTYVGWYLDDKVKEIENAWKTVGITVDLIAISANNESIKIELIVDLVQNF